MKTDQNMALVLGGTGKTGRRVVQRLQTSGHPVRVSTRAGTPLFDWNDPKIWTPALRNVDSVYLTYYPDPASGVWGGVSR